MNQIISIIISILEIILALWFVIDGIRAMMI